MRSTAAVLGSPISHSLSPLIHNLAYRQLGIKAEYIAVDVKESEFLEWIRAALSQSDQWLGFSLTMPLKEVVCSVKLEDLVVLDARSQEIGSANTLYRDGAQWLGLSTDVLGFEFLLQQRSFSRVAILGAGGTARAALAALRGIDKDGVIDVNLFRRSSYRDEKLLKAAGALTLQIADFDTFTTAQRFDLVINTVPNSGVIEAAAEFVGSDLVLDANYSPWPTSFMQRQKSDGKGIISGLELLCAQAIPQIKLMTHREFNFLEIYQLLLREAKKALD